VVRGSVMNCKDLHESCMVKAMRAGAHRLAA
jgi:hypothetical protein